MIEFAALPGWIRVLCSGCALAVFGGLLGGLLGGCDWEAQRTLRPGESTLADVERLMGTPGTRWPEDDGGTTLEYPRGPQGLETWMVRLDAQGRFVSMTNVLLPESLARVQPGQGSDAVRRMLGRPAEVTRLPLRPEEEIWSWRIAPQGGASEPSQLFDVVFDRDGKVLRSGVVRDPRHNG